MRFLQAIGAGYRQCLTFSTRSSRPEFWFFVLYVVLGNALAGRMDSAVFGAFGPKPVSFVFLLLGGGPLFAAAWRRMHDTGRSGVFLFYPAIVLIGTTSFMATLDGVLPAERDLGMNALFNAVQGVGAAVVVVGFLVFLVSPLLVIWWLTRASEKGWNKWGGPPA